MREGESIGYSGNSKWKGIAQVAATLAAVGVMFVGIIKGCESSIDAHRSEYEKSLTPIRMVVEEKVNSQSDISDRFSSADMEDVDWSDFRAEYPLVLVGTDSEGRTYGVRVTECALDGCDYNKTVSGLDAVVRVGSTVEFPMGGTACCFTQDDVDSTFNTDDRVQHGTKRVDRIDVISTPERKNAGGKSEEYAGERESAYLAR